MSSKQTTRGAGGQATGGSRSWLRAALWAVAGLFCLGLLAIAGGLVFLSTETGRSSLAGMIEDAASAPGSDLEIGALEGSLFSEFILRDVEIADAEGIWLRLDRAALRWSPAALFAGELRIARLAADRLELFRAPLAPPQETPEDSAAPGSLDPLPFDLVLEELRLDELVLGAPLLGAEARLSLAGEISATRPDGISTRIEILRRDGTPGQILLAALYRPGEESLDLSLQAEEPAGGLIARLAGIPDLPPLSLDLRGAGPIGTWQGKLRAEAGAAGELESDIELTSLTPLRASLSGALRVAGLLPPELRPLAAPETRFLAELTLTDGEALELTTLAIEAPAGRLAGSGQLDLASGDLSAALRIDPQTAVLAGAFGLPLTARTLAIDLTAGGTLDRPAFGVKLAGAGIGYQEATLDKLAGEIALTAAAGKTWRIEGSGRFEGLRAAQLEGAESVTKAIDWSLQAEVDSEFQRVSGLDLALYGGGVEISAEGEIELAALTGDATVEFSVADLAVLSGLAGTPLAGALDGEALLASDAAGGARMTLGASLKNFDSGGLQLAQSLGAEIVLFAEGESSASGAVTLHSLELDGADLALSAQGVADLADDSLAASYSLEARDLSRFSALAGTQLAGSGRIEGELGGSLAAPEVTARVHAQDLTLAGQSFPEITASLMAGNLVEAPAGTVEFQARTPYGRISGSAAALLAEENLEVSELVLETPKGESLRAKLTLPLAAGPISGELRGRFPNLELVSALTGLRVQGSGEIAIDLAARDGRQSAKLTGGFRELALAQEDGTALRLQAFDLDASAREGAEEEYLLEAAAELRGFAAQGVTLESLRLTAAGPLSELALTAEGTGAADSAAGEALAFSTAAQVNLSGPLSGSIARLQASLGARSAALNAPVNFTTSEDGFSVSALDLSIGAGRLTGTAEVAGKTVDAELRLIELPLDFLQPLLQGPELQGTLSAEASLRGAAAAPAGDYRIDIEGFRVVRRFSSELTPLALNLSGRLGDGTLTAEGRISGLSEGQDATLSAALPLRLSLAPFAVELPESEPITAALRWQGQVAPLMARLPVDDHRLEGEADIDLRLAGSLAAPELRGALLLSGATYENFVSGTLLEDMEMELAAEGDRLTIRTLTANDGEGGRLSGSGAFAVSESADSEVSASLAFSEATVIRRDDLEAKVSGDFAVEGDLGRLELTGDLTGDKIEVRLIDRLPPSVAELQVTEINTGESAAQAMAREAEEAQVSTPMEIALDLEVSLPGRVFIRGRGLDSEWEGEFQVSGTAENPSVRGQLRPVRGNFSFAGKTFELQEGSITLLGGSDLNPELNLSAVYSASNIEARVQVYGSAKDPEFELTSTPSLPQEEIVSRILFERGTAQLSAAEAFQLSTTIASLSGEGGPGIIDQARQSLGLDVLSFGAGEEGSLGEVEAGKYIADGVFVGVRQGATPQSTSAVVEVEVTPNITVESENKSTGDTSVGVRWEWDY